MTHQPENSLRRSNRINRVHFTVGLIILTLGAYCSAFLAQIILR
jgi:hypothetical protein